MHWGLQMVSQQLFQSLFSSPSPAAISWGIQYHNDCPLSICLCPVWCGVVFTPHHRLCICLSLPLLVLSSVCMMLRTSTYTTTAAVAWKPQPRAEPDCSGKGNKVQVICSRGRRHQHKFDSIWADWAQCELKSSGCPDPSTFSHCHKSKFYNNMLNMFIHFSWSPVWLGDAM